MGSFLTLTADFFFSQDNYPENYLRQQFEFDGGGCLYVAGEMHFDLSWLTDLSAAKCQVTAQMAVLVAGVNLPRAARYGGDVPTGSLLTCRVEEKK